MLFYISSKWKTPVACFLINGDGSKEKVNSINYCFDHLVDSEVIVRTLTLIDGTISNFSITNCLGAEFTCYRYQTFF